MNDLAFVDHRRMPRDAEAEMHVLLGDQNRDPMLRSWRSNSPIRCTMIGARPSLGS
jgi:hypothetical protein